MNTDRSNQLAHTQDGRALAVIESDSVVVSMTKASAALAEAVTISQTKKIMDVAAAAEIYARRQHLSEEAEQMAAKVKVEALRKLGEMLHAAPKAKGVKGQFTGGAKSEPPAETAPTLAELGLTKKESAVAQKLAALPDAEFQQVRDGHVTVAKAIAAVDAAKNPAKPAAPVAAQAEPDADDGAIPNHAFSEPVAQAADPRDEHIKDLAEELDELKQTAKELLADNVSMSSVFEADDKLATALAENKRLRAEVGALRERVNSLLGESGAQVRRIKTLMAKLKKAGLE